MAPKGKISNDINLVAVLLITRSRPGPRLVFHYPTWPHYIPSNRSRQTSYVDSDLESEDENDDPLKKSAKYTENPQHGPSHIRTNFQNKGEPAIDHLLNHSIEALEKLLTPGRWSDRKKFEICLDGLTFVGQPVYSLEDGSWSDKREDGARIPMHPRRENDHLDDTMDEMPEKAMHDFTHIPESLDSQVDIVLGTSTDSNSTTAAAAMEQMAMFHVVFVLGDADHDEHDSRVTMVYRDIAKKLSKALQYCQKQSNYMALESQKMLSIIAKSKQRRTSPKEISAELVENSELAWALKELYDRISKGEVATIRLNGMEMSLCTTDQSASQERHLGPLSALLLLESKESLLRSLSHPDASPLAHFVREHTPTKNLHKHSTNLSVPLSDVLYLAHHLLKWRKARLISPLHQRNTYIVHPDFDPSTLPQLVDSYARAFPTLPSLLNMLKFLGGRPIKYGLLVPSRDHRGPYMEILAFLVRHEIVIQLRTFGWLLMPSDLTENFTSNGIPSSDHHHSRHHSNGESHDQTTTSSPSSSQKQSTTGTSPNLLSPHLRPSNSRFVPNVSTSNMDDDTASVASDRTTVPASGFTLGKSLAFNKRLLPNAVSPSRPHVNLRSSSPSRSSSSEQHTDQESETDDDDDDQNRQKSTKSKEKNPDDHHSKTTTSILLHPSNLSSEERQKTELLRSRIEDAELRENFGALLPFLDGSHAFEEIAANLQVKRAKVEEWIGELERKKWVLVVRHI